MEVFRKGLRLPEKIFIRLITAFILSNTINILVFTNLWNEIKFAEEIELIKLLVQVFIIFIVITGLSFVIKYIDEILFIVTSIVFSIIILSSGKNIYLGVTLIFFIVLSVYFIMNRYIEKIMKIKISNRNLLMITGTLLLVTLVYVGSLVVLRYYLYRCVTFDFGIFSQMYYYMKETGLPQTTCERDYLLSHFAVHFSPVYYLILPIYVVFSHPVTIIICQLLVVFSAVIPLYLICKNKKLNNFVIMALMVAFIFYPTMRGGLFYDFHENKFLPTLILWLIYFLDNKELGKIKKHIGIVAFCFFSLGVKEDAAIYIACIGLYNLFGKKEKYDKIRGLIVFIISVAYFFIVYYCLGKFGLGTFIGRYDNYMVNYDDGLFVMITNIIKDPAYLFNQLFSGEKLEFFLWTMMPLMFTPLRQKRLPVFILFIPYIVINLMTDYGYMYDINFQYTYGSCTLLIYMAVLSFEGKNTFKYRRFAVAIIVGSILLGTTAIADRNYYYDDYEKNSEFYDEIREVLYDIPEDSSVMASTGFVPQLSMRKQVYKYELYKKETDYIIFDMRTKSYREEYENDIETYIGSEYEIVKEIPNGITVLKHR